MHADYKGVTSLQILSTPRARIEDIDLDSPRSLLACQRVGILPQELNFCPESNIDEPDPEKRRIIFESYEKDRLAILDACLNEFHKICNTGITLAESIAFPGLVGLLPRARGTDPRVKQALQTIQKRYSIDGIEQRLTDKQMARRKCCMDEIIKKVIGEDQTQQRLLTSANIVDQNKQVRQKAMAMKMKQLLRRQELAVERYHDAQKKSDEHAASILRQYQMDMKNIEKRLQNMLAERRSEAVVQANLFRRQQEAIEARRQEEEAARLQKIDEYMDKQKQVDMRLQIIRDREQTKRMLQSQKLNTRLVSASTRADQLYHQKMEQQRAELKQKSNLAEQRRIAMLESRRKAISQQQATASEAQQRRLTQLKQDRELQDIQKCQRLAEEEALFTKRKADRILAYNKAASMRKLRAEIEQEICQRKCNRAERIENFKRLVQSSCDSVSKERLLQRKEEIQHKAASFREISFKVRDQTDQVTQQIHNVLRTNQLNIVREAASVINKKPHHNEEDGLTKALSVISSAQKPYKRINLRKNLSNTVKARLERVPDDLYSMIRLAERSGGFIDYASIRLVKPGAYKDRILKSQQCRSRSTLHSAPPQSTKFITCEFT